MSATSGGNGKDLAPSKKGTETLSQFAARVLSQLELSAWFPAGALALSLLFVSKWGAVLDANSVSGPEALGEALTQSAGIGFGGAIVLLIVIVVLTIVTQAFAFGAIRVLAGYWGTSRLLERLASARCARHERKRARLEERKVLLAQKAWPDAGARIGATSEIATESGSVPFTDAMIEAVGAAALGVEQDDSNLTDEEVAATRQITWDEFADADVRRQRHNLDARLQDYPAAGRIMPTHLGNVLRASEDAAHLIRVEPYIQEVFDDLSPHLQNQHDEDRTRLELYCSMVFVCLLVGVLAFARLVIGHPPNAVAALGVGLIVAWLMY